MSYSLFQSVDFGTGRAGLTTIGYRLYTIAGGLGARVTAGVAEITDGKFGALVTFPDDFRGAVVWDSGEVSPIYAHHDINPEDLATADSASIAAIKAKTDNLPSDPADASDIGTAFTGVNTKLDTIDDFLDTEVAAIKAKTDNLPASPAATGAAMSLTIPALTSIASYVWTAAGRTLTGFGTLVADIWAAVERTLTAFDFPLSSGATAAEVADAVWDDPAADHIISGTTGELLKKLDVGGATAPVVAVPRTYPAPVSYGSDGADDLGPEKMVITFVAKLRWVEKRPNEQMIIRNFEALRLECSAILYEQQEKWAEAGAAKKEARTILDNEQKDYLAGQQLTIPMATGDEGFGYSDIGGVL